MKVVTWAVAVFLFVIASASGHAETSDRPSGQHSVVAASSNSAVARAPEDCFSGHMCLYPHNNYCCDVFGIPSSREFQDLKGHWINEQTSSYYNNSSATYCLYDIDPDPTFDYLRGRAQPFQGRTGMPRIDNDTVDYVTKRCPPATVQIGDRVSVASL